MPSLRKPFLSSSDSSSSPSESTQKVKQNKKLTRQRKLRYISDDEVGLFSTWKSPIHWSNSAVPQPLPLPDASFQSKQDNNNDHLHLPGGDPSNIANSSSNGLTKVKPVDQTTIKYPRTPTYARRGFLNRLNFEGSEQEFRLSVPPRSAPSSGFMSPVISPNRFRAGDVLFSSDHHGRRNIIASAENSPLHSPNTHRSRKMLWNPSSSQYINQKPLVEHHAMWPDSNNGNRHPLPLPRRVSRPIQPPITHNYMDNPEPPTVKGQWQKGKLIGRGTYGSVYEATHRETGALCALKEVDIIPDDPKSAECIKQLEQEIKVLRQLKHPNIVQYYGSEMIEDRLCIYLEFIHPGSIDKYVREHCGAVTECVVRNFTLHILSGLAYLHSNKTIHRDIKGANLLVNASGVVKLADFGLAKHLSGSISLSLKGTPQWMAPELLQSVLRKNSSPDHAWAVDIWSLGCTVIEMFTGKPPWNGLTEVQAMFSVLNKTPPIPESLSSEGKEFLKLCLQREPMKRPSAIELLDHPFLQNIREQNVETCLEEFSGIKLLGSPSSPKDSNKLNKEPMLFSPNYRASPIRQHSESEIVPRSHIGSSEHGQSGNHSPRSTLEILPAMRTPEQKIRSSRVSASSSPDTSLKKSRKSRIFSLGRLGRQIIHF